MRFFVDYKEKLPETKSTKSYFGHKYTLTSEYLLKDDEPYIYTMGELHFSRMKECDWERELIKMKNGGIDIVSSYLFWNHHENEKGKFDFSGNRNLRKFIDICEKLEMPFFLRIGPWVNAEARNGGFPDWLVEECPDNRSLDKKYLFYVERYYSEIYKQVETSRNIFGIQIENEYRDGTEYLQFLYDTAKRIGFDALIFSATGWDNAVLPACLAPMFGAYPEYPWAGGTQVFDDGRVYGFFSHDAEEYCKRLGTERTYPVFTCELGAGNQSTYHRRPLIRPWEIASLTVVQLGTGCKGLGYYMYHGGINPVITHSDRIEASFQCSRESGSGSDCPVVSYDFQAPLGDCGQIRQSYYELKTLFDFVRTEEKALAKMQTFRDADMPEESDMKPLRAGIQSSGESGFLFFINCFHGHSMPDKTETAIIKIKNETLSIPLSVPENGFGIIPFNYVIGSEKMKWIKAFPVKKTAESVTFALLKGIEPEYLKQDGKTGNLRNTETLGGLKVILTETPHPVSNRELKLNVSEAENLLSFDVFRHIVTINDTHLPDLTKEYTADIPDGTEYVSVVAEGNLGAAFEEKPDNTFRFVSDHFLDGDEWIVDVRGVKKLRLKIQPFRNEDEKTVYLEKQFAEEDYIPGVYALNDEIFISDP